MRWTKVHLCTKPLLSATVCLLLCGCSNVLSKPAPTPLWTTDLLQNPVYAQRAKLEGKPPVYHLASPQVAFLGSDTLAVSFTDDAQVMANLSQLLHFHFRTIFLNAKDGKFEDRELSWPTMDSDAKLLPMKDGGFVVVAGQKLYRYSSDCQLSAQASMPADPDNDSGSEFGYEPSSIIPRQLTHWTAEEDPSEEFVVLRHTTPKEISFFWLNNRLQVLEGPIKSEGSGVGFSASDEFILQGSFIGDRTGKWQLLCPAYKNSVGTFVSEDKVFVTYNRSRTTRYALATTDCTQFSDLPGAPGWRVVARAASGNRVAISEASMKDTLSGAATTVNIHLWDTSSAQELLSFRLEPQVERGPWVRAPALVAAFSPDGKRLAVLFGTTLSLCVVP